MRNRKKQIVCLVLLTLVLTGVSACGSSGENQVPVEKEASEQSEEKKETVKEKATASSATAESEQKDVAKAPVNLAASLPEDRSESGAGEAAETEAVQESDEESRLSETKTGPGAPVITENPTDESLTEGYSCMYIAGAENAESRSWRAVSPDGEIDIPYAEISSYFPYLEVAGEKQDALSLFNIPADFDGWGSYCRFENSAGSTDSRTAVTHVKALPKEESDRTESEETEPDAVEEE